MKERTGKEDLPVSKIVVRAIIVNENGQVMLGRRNGQTAKDLWVLVGGKPGISEDLLHTLTREVKEEVGFKVEEAEYFTSFDNCVGPKDSWRSVCFIVRVSGNPSLKLNGEISEIAFVTAADLDRYPIAFDHRQILEEFFRGRSKK